MKQTKQKKAPAPGEKAGCVDGKDIRVPPGNTDPEGSYTGIPLDPKEVPTQDADDL